MSPFPIRKTKRVHASEKPAIWETYRNILAINLYEVMKNTTKLRHILQLFTVSLDIDDEEQFHLTLVSKHKNGSATFVDKRYTSVVGKAYSYLVKTMKEQEKRL